MAGITITALPPAPSSLLTDVFPVDQGATTYKETLQQVLTLFQTNGTALTRVNDTNVTMILGGSPSTALLNPTSMTLGWAGQLAVPRGGTGNSTFTAYSVICAGTTATGAFQNVSGLGNAGEQLTSNGPGMLPTWQASSTVTPSPLSTVNDTNVTLTLGGTPLTSLLQAVSVTAGWTGTLAETRGGTAQNTYALGDTLYASAANTLAKLPGNITTAKQYLSQTGNGAVSAAPAWATVAGGDITGAALSKVDDTNVTLTLGGTPLTSLLRAASITAGWTGQLSLARGGTNKNITADNGAIVYSDADSFELLAATATAGQIVRSGSNAAPTWSTATYPAASGTSGNVLTSDGTNWVSSATAVVSPLTTKGDIYTFTTVNARLAVGTTNGQILQVNSGAATGLAWSTATFPSTATNAARILRSDGTNWVETTSTFADTYAASGFLYANGANNVAGLATANNGLPVTSNTGVPSILGGPGTTGNILQSNAAAAPSFSTATYPSVAGTSGKILISNGTNIISSTPTYPNAAGTSGNVITSDGTNFVSSAPASSGFTSVVIQKFTASGTYTPTTNMKYCITECLGGGGAGGSTTASTAGFQNSGGGGGSGSYSRKVSTAAAIGASQTVTIGAGGTPGATGNNAGGNGGDTSLGSICIGKGGTGGGGATGSTPGAGGAGGVAGTGDVTLIGNNGADSCITTTATSFGWNAQGSPSIFGGGPGWQSPASGVLTTGRSASLYGAGGNGGGSSNGGAAVAGGAGSAGIVIVTEFI